MKKKTRFIHSDPALHAYIVRRIHEGGSYRGIAKEVGCGKNAVYFMRKAEIKKLREIGIRLCCPCGLKISHRGVCKFRLPRVQAGIRKFLRTVDRAEWSRKVSLGQIRRRKRERLGRK